MFGRNFFLVILTTLLFSCTNSKSGDSLLDYSSSAERQFNKAMDEFEDEDCNTAEGIFTNVRRKFPYSRYAVLSELRLADCQFIMGNHAEAAVLYEQFRKAHPTHEESHYAAYKRGICFYEMIPSDWVITPPPHERDQSATRDARGAFTEFLNSYPSSIHRDRALKYLEEVVDALVRHEIYVAEFYLSRNDRRAAAVRLEKVRESFPESSLVPDAMFLQAITFLEMNKKEEALRVFREIIDFFPKHHQSLRAKEYIEHLNSVVRGVKRGTDG
jgi:outer membrane protein assembly factor BamD